eukprot:gene2432-8754_t
MQEAYNAADPAEVGNLFSGWGEDMQKGCSVFDDGDVELIREMILEISFANPAKVHLMKNKFFSSTAIMAFAVQRLYAWGSLCAMYGPAESPVAKHGNSTYVDWVLSKNQKAASGLHKELELLSPTKLGPAGRLGGKPWDEVTPKAGRSREEESAWQKWQRELKGKGDPAAEPNHTDDPPPLADPYLSPTTRRKKKTEMEELRERRPWLKDEFELADRQTGAKQTLEESAYEFFSELYNISTWQQDQSVAKPNSMLRRLGLEPDTSTSLAETMDGVFYVMDLTHRAHELKLQRSKIPVVPAPPTLAPEPLMLSPVRELPYLWVIEAPAAMNVAMGEAIDDSLELHAEEEARTLGRRMKKKEMKKHYAQQKTAATKHWDQLTAATKRWDRLVGRMVARLAWKKIQLLMHWLNMSMAFSEGFPTRATWLSDKPVEINLDSDSWTFRMCTRHLVSLSLQLKDPNGQPVMSQFDPGGDKAATLSWCMVEAQQYSLDWSVALLYELNSLAQEMADMDHRSELVIQVLSQMSMVAVRALVRRLFLRLSCLVAGIATVDSTTAADVRVSEVVAIRYASLLDTILSQIVGTAALLVDNYYEEVLHLFRTPQMKAGLADRSKNSVLANRTGALFYKVLERIRVAAGARGEKAKSLYVNEKVKRQLAGRDELRVADVANVASLNSHWQPVLFR